MSELEKIGRQIEKTKNENKKNTRRVSKVLPHVERKMDEVSSDYKYELSFSASATDNHAMLNIYIKPDNCCECFKGYRTDLREAYGIITNYEGLVIPPSPPAAPPIEGDYFGTISDGLDHRGIITSAQIFGSKDETWFAWPGYPFFNPFVETTYYENNNPTSLLTLGEQAITVAQGVYYIVFKPNVTGITTNTSKITASIKIQESGSTEWEIISRTVYSIEKGNLGEFTYGINGAFNFNYTISAICYPLKEGTKVTGFLKAEDVLYWNPGQATIDIILVGSGYTVITGYVLSATTGEPLEGIQVRDEFTRRVGVTDSTGHYVIDQIPPGWHQVAAGVATDDNYNSQTREVYAPLNGFGKIDFSLTPS